MASGNGVDINGCPDAYATNIAGRHTMLMVTQTGRGEVAVIDMTTRVVLDEDPTVPGTEFLPVGAMPVSIVSTPGGASTFVATAEPGREAIFVLPTSCIVAPCYTTTNPTWDQAEFELPNSCLAASAGNQPPHDLTQWSACQLPSTPGAMTILTDTSLNAQGEVRQTCDGNGSNGIDEPSPTYCPADWDAEQLVSPPGRRKILVTLPKLGGVALLDARNLFDQTPGTFEPCVIERWLPLSATVPSAPQAQAIPDDLSAPSSCNTTPRYSFGPPPSGFTSQPAGIAYQDGQLFVADLGVPLVHILDVQDPCNPHELPPLLPSSFDEPTRTVYTSNVAVSDLTKSNGRFVYAVDDGDGSLMAFDVSPSSSQRTPIVRPGTPYMPYDPPDRIRTNLQNARIKDLLFVSHDVPILEPGTPTATTAQLCDPLPNTTSSDSLYRTSSDYTRGASPSKLRGTFAIAALSNGQVGVVDVEDWDAPCRRPISGNMATSTAAIPPTDWRGCVNDATCSYVDSTSIRTVSDEASCKVVEPHHARSGRFFANNSTVGTSAPSLQTFPTLTSISGNISTGSSTRKSANPRFLAVPFSDSDNGTPCEYSEVFVGTSQYYLPIPYSDLPKLTNSCPRTTPTNATLLNIDPARATNNSLLLPQFEPRTYLPSENFSVTFEGKLFDDRQTGLLSANDLSLSDPDASFCDQGVQDLDSSTILGGNFVSSDPQLAQAQSAAFGPVHADFVQITSDFSDNDPYWSTPVGSACAKDPATGIAGINGCRTYFGTTNNFTTNREWQIVEAYQDHLIFQPNQQLQQLQTTEPNAVADAIANLHCCFPGTVLYTVRAANQWVLRGQQPMTNVVVGPSPSQRCIIDDNCNPRKKFLKNRIIEISSSNTICPPPPSTADCTCSKGPCGIGPATDSSAVCVVPDQQPIDPNSSITTDLIGQGCIFNSLKARFAIYSGTNPSIRDMSFVWQVVGGFVPYELNLSNHLTGSAVMPQSMTPAPNMNALFVVESVSGGVFEIVLDPFSINGDPYL